MKKIKYIYFEINQITGCNSKYKTIQNENVLLIKPHTNSSGIRGFTNMTERKGFSEPTFSIVNQYWIDLKKFKEEKYKVCQELKTWVNIVLDKLNKKEQYGLCNKDSFDDEINIELENRKYVQYLNEFEEESWDEGKLHWVRRGFTEGAKWANEL